MFAMLDNPILKKSLESAQFFYSFIRAPRQIGACIPSGRQLTNTMAKTLNLTPVTHVLELGAGTGNITKKLLEAGIEINNLTVVEKDQTMARKIEKALPQLSINTLNAIHIKEYLNTKGIHQVSHVLSSLPLLSISKRDKALILNQIHQLLGPHGIFVQFSYGLKSPIEADKRFRRIAVKHAPLNIPPAKVWVFKKV